MKKIIDNMLSSLGIASQDEKDAIFDALQGRSQRVRIELLVNLAKPRHCCPFCKSENIIKWGRKNGVQRYKCRNPGCARTFNSLTGTPFAQLHKKDKWLEMSEALCDKLSVRKAAKFCDISAPTALLWGQRFRVGLAAHEERPRPVPEEAKHKLLTEAGI